MSDDAAAERQLTFNIKASNDKKFVLTLPASTSIAALKEKLSSAEFADAPAERIRLIYSGRVLKDTDTLATHKVLDGNTIHMVKGAASNARQNPAPSSSTGAPAAPAVPTMATGTGNNPLAGLTGARYAGFHGLPSASMFGADGGMGPPPGPEDMLRMLEDPNFAQMMNESLENPAVLQMLESQPQFRDNPMLLNMIRNPAMRRMLFSPEMMRMQLQLQQQMGGGGEAFPMPGATNTTQNAGAEGEQTPGQGTRQAPNPFAGLGMRSATGGIPGANPFAQLFGGAPPPYNAAAPGATASASPPVAGDQGTQASGAEQVQGQPSNPFASLFGGAQGAGALGAPGSTGFNDGIMQMAQQMMQNPEMMNSLLGGGQAATGAQGAAQGAAQVNPFASLFGPGFGAPSQPPDNRPPEERYAEQLRQLNDMGFFEFDRNIEALRRSGGSVQGAIEFLLGGGG